MVVKIICTLRKTCWDNDIDIGMKGNIRRDATSRPLWVEILQPHRRQGDQTLLLVANLYHPLGFHTYQVGGVGGHQGIKLIMLIKRI